jgi:hypothetical protein
MSTDYDDGNIRVLEGLAASVRRVPTRGTPTDLLCEAAPRFGEADILFRVSPRSGKCGLGVSPVLTHLF